MTNLPFVDIAIIVVYLIAMVLVGFYFSRKNTSADQFTRAAGRIPGWAIGISIYATFLSSNTFLGVPGKAFGSNWNAFVFKGCTHRYCNWNPGYSLDDFLLPYTSTIRLF